MPGSISSDPPVGSLHLGWQVRQFVDGLRRERLVEDPAHVDIVIPGFLDAHSDGGSETATPSVRVCGPGAGSRNGGSTGLPRRPPHPPYRVTSLTPAPRRRSRAAVPAGHGGAPTRLTSPSASPVPLSLLPKRAVYLHTPGSSHTFFAIFFAWPTILFSAPRPLPMSV